MVPSFPKFAAFKESFTASGAFGKSKTFMGPKMFVNTLVPLSRAEYSGLSHHVLGKDPSSFIYFFRYSSYRFCFLLTRRFARMDCVRSNPYFHTFSVPSEVIGSSNRSLSRSSASYIYLRSCSFHSKKGILNVLLSVFKIIGKNCFGLSFLSESVPFFLKFSHSKYPTLSFSEYLER